mgnify:CR=1 FL=1
MSKGRLIVNAANCHSGGGKVLINGFLKGISNELEVLIYVDKRLHINFPLNEYVTIIKINRLRRFLVGFMIKKILKKNDKILYFGNLPPYIKFNCNHVFLLLSSRFYVDSISMKGFKIIDVVKIYLEKLYYNIFINNASQVIVQTSTMFNKLIKNGFNKKISIWAFDDLGDSHIDNCQIFKKESNSFIYVASLLPYKNHKRLLMAWAQLKAQGINPKLYLTLDGNNKLYKWIKEFVSKNNLNVHFLENITRQELINTYSKVQTLIYPSLFEAYGLPLVEAKKYKMKIICSDLDYCWDFIEPDDFFSPYNVQSITRAVKRFLNLSKDLDTIYTPKEFFNKIIDI